MLAPFVVQEDLGGLRALGKGLPNGTPQGESPTNLQKKIIYKGGGRRGLCLRPSLLCPLFCIQRLSFEAYAENTGQHT